MILKRLFTHSTVLRILVKLGIEILRDRPRRTLKLWQPKYISDILTRFELPNFGLVTIPTYPTDFAHRIKKVVHSSTEAEYFTCSDASRMAEYRRNVIVELGLNDEGSCMQILTDSKGAEALVGNPST